MSHTAQLLENRVVIITGASQGLGAAMAETCAAAGATVVIGAPDKAGLNSVKSRIEARGGKAHVIVSDVSRMNDLRRLADYTVENCGAIDGLINNAGVNFVKPFLQVTEDDWNRVIDIDLKGSFFMTQLCAQQMVKQENGGSIVQIASVHTLAAVPGAAPYDAAKHGLLGFSKAVAVELASQKVRVNVVSPGLCRSGIWDDIVAAAPSEEECVAFWNANIPAERLIEPEEIANACLFLLSDLSSAFTGANLLADGGMTSLLVAKEPYAARDIA